MKKSNEKVVLMLLNKKFLPDTRVEQEYNSLVANGYKVYVVANNLGYDDSRFNIIRLPNLNLFKRVISRFFNFFMICNPVLETLITKEIKNHGLTEIDLIHTHDLYWSFLGNRLAKKYCSKHIIDLHENYPEYFEDIYQQELLLIKNTLKNFIKRIRLKLSYYLHGKIFYKKYEEKMLTLADGFIVVVDEYLEYFKKTNLFDKGIVVSNTKNPDAWTYKKPLQKSAFVASYVGSIQKLRGIETVITGAKVLKGGNISINIVGYKLDSNLYKNDLALKMSLGVKNVELIEYTKNESDAFGYLRDSDIGLIPHLKSNFTDTTVPHKLFMYMCTGVPVLVSDVSPLKRIVEESGCGLVFEAGNPIDFSIKLNQMSDYNALVKFSRNGRFAAETKYNWNVDEKRLLALYKKLLY